MENSRDGNIRLRYLTPEKPVCTSEGTVKTGHGTTDWFKIEKGVCQGCIFLPCLFNLCTEYIVQNARWDESQAGIKVAE